jgi:septal ring factor EnvC (AmiA/AmiB activator)
MPIPIEVLRQGEFDGLARRIVLLESVVANHQKEIAAMLPAIERLVQEVAEQRTVTQSVLTFLAGLKEQLAAAQAELAAIGTASQTLDALAADLDAQQAELAAAIASSPAPEPPAPPPPEAS